jgi:acetyltransferase-like isoleucine patch superfamily enzyme
MMNLLKYKLIARANHASLSVGKNFRMGKDVLLSIGKNSVIEIGDNVELGDYARIYVNENARLTIGDNSSLGMFNFVSAGKSIEIGKNVMFGQFVVAIDSRHVYGEPGKPMAELDVEYGPIKMQDDIWIGAHAVILEDVGVGRGAVIGAGAVVTRDVEAYAVMAGVPAKKIKSRR